MKLKVNKKILADTLQLALPFAARKSPIAILKYGKATVKGQRIKIEANDGEGGIIRYINLVSADEEGSFLFNVADMSKLIGKLKDEEVAIIVEGETISVKHAKGTASLTVPGESEFPSFKLPEAEKTEIKVPTQFLLDYITTGMKFVAAEPLRPMLTGVYVYTKDDKFGFCATDTHCLVHDECDMPNGGIDVHFIAMPNVYGAISAGCHESDFAEISITDRHVQYRFGDLIVQSTQAKGNYPDFRRVIPKNTRINCVANKNELLDSIGRIALFSGTTRYAKMGFSMLDVTISVDNFEDAKKSIETVPHKECNGELTIGVNADMLIQVLKVCTSEDVRFEMSESSSPFVVKQDEKPNRTLLVMPMQLMEG